MLASSLASREDVPAALNGVLHATCQPCEPLLLASRCCLYHCTARKCNATKADNRPSARACSKPRVPVIIATGHCYTSCCLRRKLGTLVQPRVPQALAIHTEPELCLRITRCMCYSAKLLPQG